MIDFNVPPSTGKETYYMKQAIENRKICGDGPFTKKCQAWMNEKFGVPATYLTTSGTSALEMAALLCDLKPGDEVILPSYTFCSTADAFVQRGASLVFVDIRPDTLNIDEKTVDQNELIYCVNLISMSSAPVSSGASSASRAARLAVIRRRVSSRSQPCARA